MPEPRAPQGAHRTRAEARADDIDIRPTKLLADIEELRGELEETRRQSDEYLVALQRERAEFLNFKRRTSKTADSTIDPDDRFPAPRYWAIHTLSHVLTLGVFGVQSPSGL